MWKAITVDSATLVNKGFEVIEAHHLFGFGYDQIDVKIHPQSIVHGIVQLKNGNVLMHSSPPDMRIPIHYALHHLERTDFPFDRLGIDQESFQNRRLEFFEPDHKTFPTLKLAYEMGQRGAIWPGLLVWANEILRGSFLNGSITFLQIFDQLRAFVEQAPAGKFDWREL
jgi:1-deoxy-D-xylulose-5-phosphate reductoisomerase